MTVTDINPVTLHLVVGSAVNIKLNLVDERDESETLTGLTFLEFTIATELGSGSQREEILNLTASESSQVTFSGSAVTIALTQVDADALKAGTFIGGLKLDQTSGGKDFYTNPFKVIISEVTT